MYWFKARRCYNVKSFALCVIENEASVYVRHSSPQRWCLYLHDRICGRISMKIRYLSIILALAVILSFSSCGKRRANNSHGSRDTDTSLSADISNDVSQADSGSDSTSHPDSASGNESASESHEPASEEHKSTQTEVQESAQSTAVCEHKSTEIRGKKRCHRVSGRLYRRYILQGLR